MSTTVDTTGPVEGMRYARNTSQSYRVTFSASVLDQTVTFLVKTAATMLTAGRLVPVLDSAALLTKDNASNGGIVVDTGGLTGTLTLLPADCADAIAFPEGRSLAWGLKLSPDMFEAAHGAFTVVTPP